MRLFANIYFIFHFSHLANKFKSIPIRQNAPSGENAKTPAVSVRETLQGGN
jgi:hypothetical protein